MALQPEAATPLGDLVTGPIRAGSKLVFLTHQIKNFASISPFRTPRIKETPAFPLSKHTQSKNSMCQVCAPEEVRLGIRFGDVCAPEEVR